ncbi:hydrolase [Candidatus Protochlamydia phocaeensis]|uniref:hydrolase n=1 Tax=Candidatus Protochlamydia phocaeensis TaxID=1414722 RepID=UPI000837D7AD|nr:hydrolase [Candidatus Protochlamydia phocaeensis]
MHAYRPYLEWIKSQQTYLQYLVRTWTAINSFSTHLIGLQAMLAALQKGFACLEGQERIISLPQRRFLRPDGVLASQQLGQALSIRKRPTAPIQVLLAGHMDTVYPPSSPFQSIEEKDGQIWNGPGLTDMKGGLAILLIALAALERSPYADQVGWEILINPDEEIGSPSSAGLFQEAAKHYQLGLIFEPSFPDGAFVSERKGSVNYSIVVRGRAAHAGRDFFSGASAIYALSQFIQEVEKFNQPGQETTVNVGHIEGGGPVNIIPDLAICRLNMRSAKAEDILSSQKKLEAIAHQCMRREGIQIEVFQENLRLPKPFDSQTQKLFNLYGSCAEELGIPFQLRSTGGVCDGNTLAGAGLPTLDSIGAKGGLIHTHEEYLFLPSLVERAQLTALFLFKLATREMTFEKELSHD